MQSIRSNSFARACAVQRDRDEKLAGVTDLTACRPRLTRREIECLQWLARGCYDAQIAAHLRVSHSTVRLHLKNARVKLNARTREQALVRALQEGSSSLDERPSVSTFAGSEIFSSQRSPLTELRSALSICVSLAGCDAIRRASTEQHLMRDVRDAVCEVISAGLLSIAPRASWSFTMLKAYLLAAVLGLSISATPALAAPGDANDTAAAQQGDIVPSDGSSTCVLGTQTR